MSRVVSKSQLPQSTFLQEFFASSLKRDRFFRNSNASYPLIYREH